MKIDSIGPGNRGPARKTALAIALSILLPPAMSAVAGMETWTLRDQGRTVEAELVSFDFEEKEMVCREADGAERRVPTAALDSGSRMRLLLSREFVQSFPRDRISREQVWFILFAVAVPGAFLLAGFFLSAMILMKSVNPARAVTAWLGTVVLGGFLVSCYVFLSSRSPPGAVTGITLFGTVVVTFLLSLYVSIVYHTTLVKGLKMLVLHIAAALFLFLIALLTMALMLDSAQTEQILDGSVFLRVGLTGL